MKPTPTQIDAAIAKTPFIPNSINRAWMAEALSAALSVQPAAAVVGEMSERLRDLADQRHMDRGLDAVDDALREAASRISQQDAELERKVAEARKAAFIEAAEIAEETAQGSDHLLKAAGQAKDIQGALVHGEGVRTARIIATTLRRKAEETRT